MRNIGTKKKLRHGREKGMKVGEKKNKERKGKEGNGTAEERQDYVGIRKELKPYTRKREARIFRGDLN